MQVRVSTSRSPSRDPKFHTHFDTASGEFPNLPKIICARVWSPILWEGGHRKKANFIACGVFALDFDSGVWTIQDAQDFCESYNLNSMIGTTKSHRIAKGEDGLICDRFRLLIEAETICTNLETYEWNMTRLMALMPVDTSCKDGARFFYPCVEVVFKKLGGEGLAWEVPTSDDLDSMRPSSAAKARDAEAHRANGTIPSHIMRYAVDGVDKQKGESRHSKCYAIGAELGRIGYSFEEIYAYVMAGPLAEIGAGDVERCIRNGILRVEGDAALSASDISEIEADVKPSGKGNDHGSGSGSGSGKRKTSTAKANAPVRVSRRKAPLNHKLRGNEA